MYTPEPLILGINSLRIFSVQFNMDTYNVLMYCWHRLLILAEAKRVPQQRPRS